MKKQTKSDISLEMALENGFPESEPFQVPMVVEETKVPITTDEDKSIIRNDLFDVKTKLHSVFNFLINNVQTQMEAPGIIKASPVNDIIELAKGIVYVDKSILTMNKDDTKTTAPETPKEQHNTQLNLYGDVTADDLDKLIKKHLQPQVSGSEYIVVPDNK